MIQYLVNGEQFLAASRLDELNFIDGKLDITNLSLERKNEFQAALTSNSGKQVTVYCRNSETNEKIKSLWDQISPKVSPSVSPAESTSSGKPTPKNDVDIEAQNSKPTMNRGRSTFNSFKGIASSLLGLRTKNDGPIETRWVLPADGHVIEDAVKVKIQETENTDSLVIISGPEDREINHYANVKRASTGMAVKIDGIPGGILTLQLLIGTIKDLVDEHILTGADAYLAHDELSRFLADRDAVSDRATKCYEINFSKKSVRKSMQEVSADLRPLFFHQEIKSLNLKPYFIDVNSQNEGLGLTEIKEIKAAIYENGQITEDAPFVIVTTNKDLIIEIANDRSEDRLAKYHLIEANLENLADKAKEEIPQQLSGNNKLILDSAIIISNSDRFYAKFLDLPLFQSKVSHVKIGSNTQDPNHTGFVRFNDITDLNSTIKREIAEIREQRNNDRSITGTALRMAKMDFERPPEFPYTSAVHEYIKNRVLNQYRETFSMLATHGDQQVARLQEQVSEVHVAGRIIDTKASSQVTEERKSELKQALKQQVSFEKGLLVAYAVNLAPSLIKMIDPTLRAAISGSDSLGALVKVIPNYLTYKNTVERIDSDYSHQLSAHFNQCLAYAIKKEHANPRLAAYRETLSFAKKTIEAQNNILDTFKSSESKTLAANALLGTVGVAAAAYGIKYNQNSTQDQDLVGDRIAIAANGLTRAGNFFTAHSFIMDGIIRRNGQAKANNRANQFSAGFEERLDELHLEMSASRDKDLNQETTRDNSEAKQTASNSNSALPLPDPSAPEEEPNLKILAKPRYALLDLSNDGHFYPNKSSAELKEQIALDLALIRENISNYNQRYKDGSQKPNLDRYLVIADADNVDIINLVQEINSDLDFPIQLFKDSNEAIKELPQEGYTSMIAFSNSTEIINDMARRQFAISVASSEKAKMADIYLESVSQLRTTAARKQSSGWMSSVYEAMMNYLVMTRSWGKLPENDIHKALLDRKIRNGVELLAIMLPEPQLNLVDQGIHSFFGIASFHEKVIKAGHNLSADGLKKNIDREIYYNLARFLQMWVRPALVVASTANLVWVDANQVSAIIQAVTSYPILRATTIQKQETWNWKKADVLSGYESSARQSILDKNWELSSTAVKNLALYRALLEMDQMQIFLDAEEQKLRQIEDRLLNTALSSGVVVMVALGLVFAERYNPPVLGRILGGASFLSTALAGGVAGLQVYQYYEAVDKYKQLLDTVAKNAQGYRPDVEDQHLRGVIEHDLANVLSELEKINSLEAMDEKKGRTMKMMVAEIIPEYLGLFSNEAAKSEIMDKLKALNSSFTSTTKDDLMSLLWDTRIKNKKGTYFPLTEQTRIVQQDQRSLAGSESTKTDHTVIDMGALDADEQQNQGVGSSGSSSSEANPVLSDQPEYRTEYYAVITDHHPGKAKGRQTAEGSYELKIKAGDVVADENSVFERQVLINPPLSAGEAEEVQELIDKADKKIDRQKLFHGPTKDYQKNLYKMKVALNQGESDGPTAIQRIQDIETALEIDPYDNKLFTGKKVSKKVDALNLEPSKAGNTPVSKKGKSAKNSQPRSQSI